MEKVKVSFHQCSLETEAGIGLESGSPEACYAGQTNGLCGAAIPGWLIFTTGLHSGRIGFTVDVLDAEPPLDENWEEIVEVSFVQEDIEASLVHFYGPAAGTLPLAPGTYRARYCAKNMDQANEADTHRGDPPINFYSLIFWPATVASDAILKQTAESARYWHQTYGESPS